jgi:putative SOS response-associated peptidase YedK
MCNRKHQTEKAVQLWLDLHGVAIDADWTDRPRPGQIFPTGKKTPRYGLVVRRKADGNRPLLAQMMEWGFPTQVPSARDPSVKLTKYVTNARNLKSPFWRSSLANPANRCLVPFTHFAEPHPEGGKGDDGMPKQAWFCLPDQPVGVFAGFWRPTERGPAYAFATCEPNAIVGPIHPKAMPAILKPGEWDQWLDGTAEEAAALVRPYDGPMDMQVTTPRLSDGGALDIVEPA